MYTAVSAIWVRVEDKAAPLGYWMKPSAESVLYHPLAAKTERAADKEVDSMKFENGRKLWAYGETDKVIKNTQAALNR